MTNQLSTPPSFVAHAARCLKLVKRYGDVSAVNGLDLDVHTG
jgi:hypothetical protein